MTHSLVKPLEIGWQHVVDEVLRSLSPKSPLTTKDIAKLAPKVEALSRAYNEGAAEGARTKLPLEARVAFSFARDVPKGAAAVRELVATGALSLSETRPLRVLDLGAGLGAMTWGVARALGAAQQREAKEHPPGVEAQRRPVVEALLVDEDEDVLRAAMSMARAVTAAREENIAAPPMNVDLRVDTRRWSLADARAGDRGLGLAPSARDVLVRGGVKADVVILGQVLSELDPQGDPERRLAQQSELVTQLLESVVADDGSLVIVEPALRDRTRHLHALRDRVLEQAKSAHVFAPCLHQGKCPALAIETEWCHEDLEGIDLPPWVASLARAAGLRWQGLTFSYLVLRKDGRRLLPALSADALVRTKRFRAISHVLKTKGKAELIVCHEEPPGSPLQRIRQLDRDAAKRQGGSPFEDLRRGDVVSLSVAPEEAPTQNAAEVVAPKMSPVIDERGRVNHNVAIDVGRFCH